MSLKLDRNNPIPFMSIQRRKRFCILKSVCGRELHQGVTIIAGAATLISLLTCIMCAYTIAQLTKDKAHNRINDSPENAAVLVCSLVLFNISIYQIIISLTLLLDNLKNRSGHYTCSLWFISHMSILPIYAITTVAKAATSLHNGQTFAGIQHIIIGLVYEGIFIYFCVIVHSFMDSLYEKYDSINVYIRPDPEASAIF